MTTEHISENNSNTLKIMSITQQNVILRKQAQAVMALNASAPEVANTFLSKIRIKIAQAKFLSTQSSKSSKPSVSTLREIARKKRLANEVCGVA
ncbi:MAG: hypothetical protein ACI9LM_000121 [Alteromonadaceae bacterium]|jgi:hypothetical protein